MATARIDIRDVLPDVLTHAPDAPNPVVLRHIRNSARTVCMRLRQWRESDTITVTDPLRVRLSTVTDADICEILNARLDNQSLEPVSVEEIDETYPGWESQTVDASGAKFIGQTSLDEMIIVPLATGTLTCRLTLMPSKTCATLPKAIAEQHSELIVMGAAAGVLMTPKANFGDPAHGAALSRQFSTELARAHVRATKGQQRTPLRTRGQYL